MSDTPSFVGRSLLVVGGAGFVGSNLVRLLLETEPRAVTIVDNFLSAERENIPNDSRVRVINGSVADANVIAQLPDELDYVWHLACYHGNQSSIHDPLADHDNNSLTSLVLFEALSKRSNVTRVVYSAAGCAVAEKTYDTPCATPEDAPVSLFHDSPYSISKIVGEMYGNYYFTKFGMPFVKARFQNVYGPGEILGAGRWRGTPATVWRNVIPTFIWKALHNDTLGLDNEGLVSRDFIFVEDICRGLIACALRGTPGEAYNLASGVETTIRELAETIVELTDSSSSLEVRPARDWDNSGRRFGSTEKSLRELRFEATVNLRAGLESTVLWTRSNIELIRSNVEKHSASLSAIGQSRS